MKKLLSILISSIILALIYYRINFADIINIIISARPIWLAASLFMFIPTIMGTAIRLKLLSPVVANITLKEALKLVLTASSLNMVLPSKMGDIAKGYFIAEKSDMPLSKSLFLVVYEKAYDILSLLLWCVLGLTCYPQKDLTFFLLLILTISGLLVGSLMVSSKFFAILLFRSISKISPKSIVPKIITLESHWIEIGDYLNHQKLLILKVATMSILIWFMHLLQIWLFIRTIGGVIPFPVHLGLTPLGIFAGLIPLTLAGIGTRDATLLFFLSDYLGASLAAALGILCTFRYIVPAVFGLPFLNEYIMKIREMQQNEYV